MVLVLMNLRGVKESVTALAPIFLTFLATHAILIVGGTAGHAFELHRVAAEVRSGFSGGLATLGAAGLFGIFLRAYSMGAGTYTGIEAVSNGLQIMREPKVETARRTMTYMGLSLALTAGGILLLSDVPDRAEKLVYFMGIDECRFRRPVVPGDQLVLEVEVLHARKSSSKVRGVAKVDGQVAAEATILSVTVDRQKGA